MAKKSETKNASSWRKLKKVKMAPKAQRASVSWRARLRKVFKFCRWFLLFLLACGLGYGAFYVWQNVCVEDVFAPKHEPLKSIEFKSDGVITAHWLSGILKIPKNSTIADVNIFHLKKILEDVSQIKHTKVDRIYPDILRIEISEQKPAAKIRVNVDSKEMIFLVTEDGFVFRPICYSPEQLDTLICIEGVKFESGRRIDAAKKLKNFLDEAAKRFPDEVSKWKIADVSQLNSITLPLLTITTAGSTKIIFDSSDIKKQFDKFDYILRYSKQRSLNDFEKIDLSLKDRADAKLKPNSR